MGLRALAAVIKTPATGTPAVQSEILAASARRSGRRASDLAALSRSGGALPVRNAGALLLAAGGGQVDGEHRAAAGATRCPVAAKGGKWAVATPMATAATAVDMAIWPSVVPVPVRPGAGPYRLTRRGRRGHRGRGQQRRGISRLTWRCTLDPAPTRSAFREPVTLAYYTGSTRGSELMRPSPRSPESDRPICQGLCPQPSRHAVSPAVGPAEVAQDLGEA